jgi:hypothetical protein
MEHRFGHRVSTQLPVALEVASQGQATGRVRNVSVSGTFVQTDLRAPFLVRVRVYFDEQHSRGSLKFALDAYLVRSTPEGLGLEWVDTEPAILQTLLSTLERSQEMPTIS